jgi:hypothetical protein
MSTASERKRRKQQKGLGEHLLTLFYFTMISGKEVSWIQAQEELLPRRREEREGRHKQKRSFFKYTICRISFATFAPRFQGFSSGMSKSGSSAISPPRPA